MELQDKVAVVTGGGNGIGAGIARRFAQEGARAVVVADLDLERARSVADGIGAQAMALPCDVSREADIQALVAQVSARCGPVDVFVSNAGILGREGGIELDDALWNRMWAIHGMAHVSPHRPPAC